TIVAHLVINDVLQLLVTQETKLRWHATGIWEVLFWSSISDYLDIRVEVLFGGCQIGRFQLVGACQTQACSRPRLEACDRQCLSAVCTPSIGSFFDTRESSIDLANHRSLTDI